MNDDVPPTHPRFLSLQLRDRVVAGVEQGVTSVHGLIAHGRGEAFDYLLGECTCDFARDAIRAAAAMLVSANHPVVSVNGNTAALAAEDFVAIGEAANAPLEVNIFHSSEERERAIESALTNAGAKSVLMPSREAALEHIDSNRRFVHPDGILKADVVFVPLEDGDRCAALRQCGKDVVTVDLNPLSRTARTASVTIVDHLIRALPLLIEEVRAMAASTAEARAKILADYDNGRVLDAATARIRSGTR
jgi:4-phosphopantoate--beta-alanine ligase